MDFLNDIVTNALSWFLLRWQGDPFRISFVIVMAAVILAIAFAVIGKTKKTDKKINKRGADNMPDPNFKVVEEIIQTDSKNIIA